MPQIKEYRMRSEVQGAVQTRRAYGEDIGFGKQLQQAGQAVEETGDQVQKRDEQAEVSELHAKLSELHANKSNQWRDDISKADPNDREIGQRFNESLNQDMEKVSEGIKTGAGRQFFTRQSASIKAHFTETTAVGQAELAGKAAIQNYTTALNNFSSSVMNDPSSLENRREANKAYLNTLVATGTIPREHAIKLEQDGDRQLAIASVRGWMDLDPEGTKKELANGKWRDFLGSEEEHQLDKEADISIHARETEESRRKALEKEALVEQQKATQNTFLEKMAAGKLSTKDVLKSNLEAFGSGSKEQFINMIKDRAENGGKPKTDYTVFNDAFKRIHLPDGDPQKINDENMLNDLVVKRKITLEDARALRKEMQGDGTMAGKSTRALKDRIRKDAEAALVKTNALGMKDPEGEANMTRFTADFMETYDEQRKKGKSDKELLDPQSPDYLGKLISKYQRSNEEIVRSMTKGFQTPVPSPQGTPTPAATPDPAKARRPGESIQQYRDRMKSGA
jgi:hypothetical protein